MPSFVAFVPGSNCTAAPFLEPTQMLAVSNLDMRAATLPEPRHASWHSVVPAYSTQRSDTLAPAPSRTGSQGLTLVHVSAQPEPFPAQNTP
jgi:hypothetical protein